MNPTRRPPKPEDVAPRRVADGTGRALREHLGPPPEGNFADGVEAHLAYRNRMTPDMGEMWELGEYIEPTSGDRSGAVHLDGEPPKLIKFPPWWRPFLAKQTRRTLSILDMLIVWLDAHGEDEARKRLSDLDEIVASHRSRKKLIERLKWASKFGIPTALTTWGLIILFKEKVDRVIEQWPLIQALWKAITGPAS